VAILFPFYFIGLYDSEEFIIDIKNIYRFRLRNKQLTKRKETEVSFLGCFGNKAFPAPDVTGY